LATFGKWQTRTTTSTNATVSAVIMATPGYYLGFTLRETSGSASATVVIYDNASAASGTILEEITLASSESAREFYHTPGIRAVNGVYFSVVSGAVAGSVRTTPN
jgi:hypothetical protein